jgi:hypothetical protein
MKNIEMDKARKIEVATKNMVASLDPALAETLVLKQGVVNPYLELPNCFFIQLGPFAVHTVYYVPRNGGEPKELFCTRQNPADKFAARMTVAEMLDNMRRTKYLWLPKDSIGHLPALDEA